MKQQSLRENRLTGKTSVSRIDLESDSAFAATGPQRLAQLDRPLSPEMYPDKAVSREAVRALSDEFCGGVLGAQPMPKLMCCSAGVRGYAGKQLSEAFKGIGLEGGQ
jgi:hypothetical protein